MEDYYEYLDSNGVTTLYKLIKDDTVALIDSYSVTINGITTTLDNHVNNADIHTPIATIEGMIDTKVAGLVNSAPETLDTLKELSDALGNDPNFATTVANQIGSKASKDDVYTKGETDTLLEGKANSVHSHVVSDITDMPTIPTKTSQLINDSGFITGISWDKVTDKPTLATVATSGSYTDLSNTPAIPTKVSQLENDMGFGTGGDTSDCVHKTGNETINGVKTFTAGPVASNYATTNGYFIKLNPIGRGEVPSQLYHATFRALDKTSKILGEYCVEKSTSGDSLLNMNVRSEDSSGNQISYGLQFRMTNDGSVVRFIPTSNNKVHLGDVNAKWLKVHSDDVVHTSGDETINGVKTFTSSPFVSNYAVTNGYFTKLNTIARNEVPSQIYHSAFRVFDKNDKTLGECCVEKSTSGSSLLHMDVHTEDSEGNDIMESVYLNLSNDGSTVSFHPAKNNRTDLGMAHYKWAKIYSDDVVHTSGNETINGTKTFTVGPVASNSATTNGYFIKLNAIARNEVPTKFYHATFRAHDKNDKILGEYCVEKSITGSTLLNMNVRSEDSNGNQLSESVYLNMSNDGSAVRFHPSSNNKMDLGTFNQKWAKVYSDDVVHTSGNETISGVKTFSNDVRISKTSPFCNVFSSGYIKGQAPTSNIYSGVRFFDDINSGSANTITGGFEIEYNQDGYNKSYISSRNYAGEIHKFFTVGLRVPNDATRSIDFLPSVNGIINLGTSTNKWKDVYATTFNGNLKGTIDSSTTATTQATTDNSTKIATTAWVRTYVNSVAGSNTVGSSVSAYWSNSSNVTATGQASSDGKYPECYSKYVTKTPVVGTIYSGAQLYTVLNTYASATGSLNNNIYVTNNTAQATFSNPISATGKYLCTTANTVKFRAYTATGSSSAVGSSSVVDNASTKSIFIRVE